MRAHALRTIGVGAVYFVACYVALLIDTTNGAASVWPASGLLLGVLLLTPTQYVLSILAGAFVGGVIANLGVGFPVATSVGYAFINIGEGLAGRWLVQRYFPDAPRLSQPLNGFALIACGAVVAVAGACIAATLAYFTEDANWFKVLGTWAGSDAAGVVIVSPVILSTAGAVQEIPSRLPRWRVVEAAFLLAILIGISCWLYLWKHPSQLDQFANPLLILPLVAWAAIRFEAIGAAWAIFIVNAFCVWGTALGMGPLVELTPSSLVNLVIQARVGITGMVALSLGAAIGTLRRSAVVHRRLAQELQAAVDSERTRLSHELHDEVAQKLAALKMQLQLADINRTTDRAATTVSSVAIVDDVLANVRAMSHSLRPAPFDRGQLLPALTAMARAEGNRAGLRVLIDSPDADLSLPHEIELVCYRVAREAVSNAVKHASAQHVAVSLDCRSDHLTLSIVDDGRGFDVAPTTRQAVRDGHLGLVGMRERLDCIGGTLSINSTLGRGTTITCLVPIGVAA